MSFLDLNTAETGGSYDVLPEGTVARAILEIRPGQAGPDGWFKLSKAGGLMLDCKWVITEGKFAKRVVFDYMMTSGSEKAEAITRKNMRAIVEGHFGINPEDNSDAARAARNLQSVAQLNGMEACLLIGIEHDAEYGDKNKVKAVLAPGESKYLQKGQYQPEKPKPAAATAAPAYGYQAPPAGYQPGHIAGAAPAAIAYNPAPAAAYNPAPAYNPQQMGAPAPAAAAYDPAAAAAAAFAAAEGAAAGAKPTWAQ